MRVRQSSMKYVYYFLIGILYFIPLLGPPVGAYLLYRFLKTQGWTDKDFTRELITENSKHGWWISSLMWTVMLEVVPRTKV